MLTPSLGFFLLAAASIAECRSLLDVNHVHRRYKRQNEDATGLLLVASAVQSGSANDGSNDGVIAPGQSKSQVSQNNFINFCKGKTLTNGLQVQGGSCNGIPMGEIPSKQNMVSSIITFPLAGSATIEEKTDFSISVQMINFVAGSFTNAQLTYYAAPQALSGGKIVGHTHVTVQDMGPDLNPKQPLDATQFVFFKGINDAGDGNGLLSATVPGGLPAGNYRVCTMASASNHQLVLMPVAQRGAQDDCTKFTVIAAGTGGKGDDTEDSVSSTTVKAAGQTSTSLTLSTTSAAANISTSAITSSATTTTTSAITSSATTTTTTTTSLDTSTSVVDTSPAETAASETASIETSISESLPVLSSSPPPFANSSFVAAKTTTRGRGGNGKPPKTKTTTKLTLTTKKANASSSTTLAAAALSTTTTVASTSITTTSKLVATSAASAALTTTTKAGNNGGGKNQGGGKNNNNNNNIKVVNNKPTIKIIKVVHKVTIIRTFFTFKNSLGGLPPAVNKKGNVFAVLDQLFDSLTSACDAACGHQYKTCISFSGPGFEITECKKQRKDCGVAAQIVTSQAAETPKTITATVTVPPSASVAGQIIGEETVVSSVEVPASSVAAAAPQATLVNDDKVEDVPAAAEPTVIQEEQSAPTATSAPIFIPQGNAPVCAPPRTVTVERTVLASATPTASPIAIVDKPLFSNSTLAANATLPLVSAVVSASSSSSTTLPSPTPTPSAQAQAQASIEPVAGIAAPAISASGDASRPFLVNGNTFVNEGAAKQRSCDIQFNKCADAVNGGKAIGVLVGDCEKQKVACGGK